MPPENYNLALISMIPFKLFIQEKAYRSALRLRFKPLRIGNIQHVKFKLSDNQPCGALPLKFFY